MILDKVRRSVVAARRRSSPAGRRPGPGGASPPRPARVLFVNDLWGYGTVTMATAIAEDLADRGIARLFAGMGPGFELARRGPFDGLVLADTMAAPMPSELEQQLGSCQAVVSVLNERIARAAARRGIPCVFVDCLGWMWATPPDLPPEVAYYQESFPGAAERLPAVAGRQTRAEIVGPLITRPSRIRASHRDAALVNFGGLSCSLLSPTVLTMYADAMAHAAVAALQWWPGRIVVGVGRHVLDRLDVAGLRAIHSGVDVIDLGHDAYLAELGRSHVLISSAGMHALYEAFALGVPCLCLPSQNLSQALTLPILERHGVARFLDWSHLYGIRELDAADEAGATRYIAAAIERFSRDTAARDRLVSHLRDGLVARRLIALQRRQAQFFARLGEPGGPLIAAHVRELLRDADGELLPTGA
jgi:hypothetical protein